MGAAALETFATVAERPVAATESSTVMVFVKELQMCLQSASEPVLETATPQVMQPNARVVVPESSTEIVLIAIAYAAVKVE